VDNKFCIPDVWLLMFGYVWLFWYEDNFKCWYDVADIGIRTVCTDTI
jgi:hypothetical protein